MRAVAIPIAVLLLHRGEVVSSEQLIAALWGERPPPTAAKSVQVYVSHLRRVLGDGRLVTRHGGHALEIEAGALDWERFEELVAAGRRLLDSGDAGGARDALVQALAPWRSPALQDFAYEAFAATDIARLKECSGRSRSFSRCSPRSVSATSAGSSRRPVRV